MTAEKKNVPSFREIFVGDTFRWTGEGYYFRVTARNEYVVQAVRLRETGGTEHVTLTETDWPPGVVHDYCRKIGPRTVGDPLFQEIWELRCALRSAFHSRKLKLNTQWGVDKATVALLDKIDERMAAFRDDKAEHAAIMAKERAEYIAKYGSDS